MLRNTLRLSTNVFSNPLPLRPSTKILEPRYEKNILVHGQIRKRQTNFFPPPPPLIFSLPYAYGRPFPPPYYFLPPVRLWQTLFNHSTYCRVAIHIIKIQTSFIFRFQLCQIQNADSFKSKFPVQGTDV